MLFPGLKQLLCLVSPSNVCHQHLYQHIQIQAAALMTVIQAVTIRGRLLCEPPVKYGM